MSLLGISEMVSAAANTEMHMQDLQAQRDMFLASQQFNHDESQLAYERALQADATKYQRQVADLQAAGLNPMLAVGQAAGSVHPSPASSSGGSVPSAPNLNFSSPMSLKDVASLDIQRALADAEITLKGAQTKKVEAETEGQENENRLFRDTEELQKILLGDEHERNEWEKEIGLRGVQVKEDNQRMLEEQSRHYNAYLEQQSDYIHELKVSEETKREMYRANARESRQNAAYKAAMQEVDRQYREAATETEKEQKLLLGIEARIKNGIYTPDYIRSICREAKADAEYHEIMTQYYKGDYSAASKNLQKVFKELERKGTIMPIGAAFGESTRAASVLPGLN